MQHNLSAVQYFVQLIHKKPIPKYSVVLKVSMELLLKALSLVMSLSDDSSSFKQTLDDALGICNETVKNWINTTVGGKMFGKEVASSILFVHLSKTKEEFTVRFNIVPINFLYCTQVWEQIFSVKCPEELVQHWEPVVLSIVKGRLEKVSDNVVTVVHCNMYEGYPTIQG